ncbi:MAG: NAD-dependent epimerase/dehydratase family protein [Chitinophagales bacterium]|nr:NAD-dependent epimerase/dehydratase family protein [Chitinophagales bacterium]
MILVTGANGFLGAALVRALVKNGEQVRILVRENSRLDRLTEVLSAIEIAKGDILDIFSLEEAMKGVSEIYHCAAWISFLARDRNGMFKTNIDGTANVVNMALTMGIPKFVHISSIAAIGANPEKGIIDEACRWEKHEGNSEYGLSKYLAENEVFRGVEEGLHAMVVNPGIILGINNGEKASRRMWELVDKGTPYYAVGTNGFVTVEDVVSASISAMKSGKSGERYILVGENLSMQELCTEIAENLNKKPPKKPVPKLLLYLAFVVDKFLSLIMQRPQQLTLETIRLSSIKFSYDNNKAKKELGINFTPLKKTIADISKEFLEKKKSNE